MGLTKEVYTSMEPPLSVYQVSTAFSKDKQEISP